MTRTTRSELDSLIKILNRRLDRPEYGWERQGTRNVANVGAFTLDRSYGGNRLQEVITDGGALREYGPRLPAGPMADYLRAMLEGIDLARPRD